MSIKVTQNYRLFTLLQSGEVVTQETIEKTLGIGKNSVPVYVFELRKLYKAEIESIRQGRKVVAYQLKNKIKVPQYRSNNAQVNKKSEDSLINSGNVSVLDKDNDLTQLDDRDMADIREQLEIGSERGDY